MRDPTSIRRILGIGAQFRCADGFAHEAPELVGGRSDKDQTVLGLKEPVRVDPDASLFFFLQVPKCDDARSDNLQ